MPWKADQVLQEKAKSLPNVEIFVSSQTTEVVGNGDKVTGIRTKDRKTGEERVIHLDGIFVQIGLAANSGVFKEIVETNRPGEIVIDAHCRTNVPGIYAAGDVSTVPFIQMRYTAAWEQKVSLLKQLLYVRTAHIVPPRQALIWLSWLIVILTKCR